MDINQNVAMCIVKANNIGSTAVHNICSGTSSVVPWGSADWVAVLGLSGLIATCLLALAGLVYAVANS
jgi:hypothetical protein